MRALWPEVLLAVLFLAGDLFFSGTAAVAAAASAGAIAYLASLLAGRRRTVLLLEGIILAALSLAALLTSFPGGPFILFELVLGAFLLVSGLLGKPALEAVTGSLAKGMIPSEGGSFLSAYAGGAFLFHGALSVLINVLAGADTLLCALLSLPVFVAAGVLSSRRLGRIRKLSLPVLEGAGDGMTLKAGGKRLGEVTVHGEGSAAAVAVIEMEPGNLPLLERALARLGHRAVLITAWPHDTLLLSMSGYSEAGPNWRKILR